MFPFGRAARKREPSFAPWSWRVFPRFPPQTITGRGSLEPDVLADSLLFWAPLSVVLRLLLLMTRSLGGRVARQSGAEQQDALAAGVANDLLPFSPRHSYRRRQRTPDLRDSAGLTSRYWIVRSPAVARNGYSFAKRDSKPIVAKCIKCLRLSGFSYLRKSATNVAFRFDSSRYLNCHSKLTGQYLRIRPGHRPDNNKRDPKKWGRLAGQITLRIGDVLRGLDRSRAR